MVPKNKVLFYREKMGLSKQKLSQLTGISPSNLYHIETGRVFPYPGWRRRLSEALQAQESDLFPQYKE